MALDRTDLGLHNLALRMLLITTYSHVIVLFYTEFTLLFLDNSPADVRVHSTTVVKK